MKGPPPWTLLALEAPAPAEDEISRALCGLGALGVQALQGGPPGAQRITLRAWFEAGRPVPCAAEIEGACPGVGEIRLVSVAGFEDGRWVERWVESLAPFEIGERFRILPVADPDTALPLRPGEGAAAGRLTLRIVPGRAFGTGEHATTRLCLEALERHGAAGADLLDVGTGSGILAMAGAALGCRRAVGIDIDGEALQVARRNLALNGAAGKVLLVQAGPEAIGAAFDRVVANLNGGLLEALMSELIRCLRPGGILILSGLLESEAEEGEAWAAGGGAPLLRSEARDGWACTVHEKAGA